jgi:LemA protein
MSFLLPLIIVGVLLLVIIGLYNALIGKKNNVAKALGSIDVYLKKRYDLIPNLVETVRQYTSYERETLQKITELRARATTSGLPDNERVNIDNQLSGLLRGVMVAVENYPDLKANTNFLQLQAAWNEVEEQLSAARRAYNAAVTEYNNAVEMFPTNIMAQLMKYRTKQLFEIPEQERQNVDARQLFTR